MEGLKQYNKINDLILLSSELFILINEKEEKQNEIEYKVTKDKKLELIIGNESPWFNKFNNLKILYIHI